MTPPEYQDFNKEGFFEAAEGDGSEHTPFIPKFSLEESEQFSLSMNDYEDFETGRKFGAYGTGAQDDPFRPVIRLEGILPPGNLPVATCDVEGISKPDCNTLTVTDGVLSALLATNADFGIVMPDNSTITITDGVISAVGGGGGFVTEQQTDTGSGLTFANGSANAWIGLTNNQSGGTVNLPAGPGGPGSASVQLVLVNNQGGSAYTATAGTNCHFYNRVIVPAGDTQLTVSLAWNFDGGFWADGAGLFQIDGGNNDYAANSAVNAGQNAQVAIGFGASSQGNNDICIGTSATTTNSTAGNNVVIGYQANSGGNNGVVVIGGNSATATNSNQILLNGNRYDLDPAGGLTTGGSGLGVSVDGASITINGGNQLQANIPSQNFAIDGSGNDFSTNSSITGATTNAVCIGVGASTQNTNDSCVVIGPNSTANGCQSGVAIGAGAQVEGANSISIGANSDGGNANCVVIGGTGISASNPNQIILADVHYELNPNGAITSTGAGLGVNVDGVSTTVNGSNQLVANLPPLPLSMANGGTGQSFSPTPGNLAGFQSGPVIGDTGISQASLTQIVASGDLTGQSGAVSSVAAYTLGSGSVFRVGGYVVITAVSLDVLQLQVAWTDETNTSRTLIMLPVGGATLSTTGAYCFPDVTIAAKSGTTITLKTVLATGTGSITYDVGGTIEKLR